MVNSCAPLQCVHYADDTTLYLSHADVADAFATVNAQLRDMDEWLSISRLSLNLEKTTYMIVTNLSINFEIYNVSIGYIYIINSVTNLTELIYLNF